MYGTSLFRFWLLKMDFKFWVFVGSVLANFTLHSHAGRLYRMSRKSLGRSDDLDQAFSICTQVWNGTFKTFSRLRTMRSKPSKVYNGVFQSSRRIRMVSSLSSEVCKEHRFTLGGFQNVFNGALQTFIC